MVIPTRAAAESVTSQAPAAKKAQPKEEEPYVAEVVADDEVDDRIEARRPRSPQRDEEDDYDRPRGRRRDLDDDRPRRRRDDDEEDDYDRPRRRRPGRRRSRWRGEYADCPKCGARGDATKQTFTWWGGFIGPMIINHVRCNQCGTTYNGIHGDDNTTRILIYTLVCTGIPLGLCLIGGLISAIAGH
jgi:hypothetical protein